MTEEKIIFSACLGRLSLIVKWSPEPNNLYMARCIQSFEGVTIEFNSKNVCISSIVHEIHHAIDWFSALGQINGREEQAQYMGEWTESILSTMLDIGWEYSVKENGMWLIGKKVALQLK